MVTDPFSTGYDPEASWQLRAEATRATARAATVDLGGVLSPGTTAHWLLHVATPFELAEVCGIDLWEPDRITFDCPWCGEVQAWITPDAEFVQCRRRFCGRHPMFALALLLTTTTHYYERACVLRQEVQRAA